MTTTLHRISRLVSALLSVAALAGAGMAWSQAGFPGRPVHIVVPGAPGTGFDSIARLIAPGLADRLGRQVVVENRAGAGSLIGNEYVAKAAPDGHTLLMAASGLTIHPALIRKMPYDVERDFAPVTLVVSVPNVILVGASSPAKTIGELIALAKARPGQLQFASAGVGSNSHLTMQMFVSMAQINVPHVAYKGATPGLTDLLGGHVAIMSLPVADSMPHVRSGKLRALAVTSAKRVAAAPTVPTVAEAALPGYESLNWFGLLAPAKTPPEIIERLQRDIVAVLRETAVRDKLLADNTEPVGNTPAEFAAFIKEQIAKWAAVAKNAGIIPE
ncbi:MAG: Bug family tripartite tricarboxylate transporter substrate binding protein [Burkholderiales bacterium]